MSPIDLNTTEGSAISLNNNALITLEGTALVTNNAGDGNLNNGRHKYGLNTIEFRDESTLIVGKDAQVIKTGKSSNSEAVNIIGENNKIINYGLIQAGHSSAIWIQNTTQGRNTVDNYGTIERTERGDVLGVGGSASIHLINRNGAEILGDVKFARGQDELELEAGSRIEGLVNGSANGPNTPGEDNNLILSGDAEDRLSDAVSGSITNFATLTKNGQSNWTLEENLTSIGIKTLTVNSGILVLEGTNSATIDTSVAGGTLALDDDAVLLADNPVDVATGASLGGYGRLVGDLTNEGTVFVADALAPFNDGEAGNFTINGNLTNNGLAQIGGAGVGNNLLVTGNYESTGGLVG